MPSYICNDDDIHGEIADVASEMKLFSVKLKKKCYQQVIVKEVQLLDKETNEKLISKFSSVKQSTVWQVVHIICGKLLKN